MKKELFTKVLQGGIRKVLRNPKYRWLAIVAGLFYFFSPVDILPDVIPFVGWIDDGIVISFLMAEVSQIVVEQIQSRKKNTAYSVETIPVNEPINDVIDVEAVRVV